MSARLVAQVTVGPYPVDVWEHGSPIDEGDPQGQLDRSTRPLAIRYHKRCQGTERLAVLFHEPTHLALYLHSVELNAKVEQECALLEAHFDACRRLRIARAARVPEDAT